METSPHLADRWAVHSQLKQEEFNAARTAGIDPIQAQLLSNRGIETTTEMRRFLDARYEETLDPNALIDMPRAVERILHALEQQEHITVYGDYDADGVTSSALLFRALRLLKKPEAILDFHIPHRLKDGCGLNRAAIDMLKTRGTQLIITTDCASSDIEQVDYASTLDIDIIITDHHQPPATLPRAYAMINPWRSDCQYGERYLCGVGIAFKLVQALYRVSQRTREEEMALLDMFAIGTVADIAPLLGENHTYVRLGLQQLNTAPKPGIQALIKNSRLTPGRIRERDIAFGIAPRINAAGRMEVASIAFELMITDDITEAEHIAAKLEQLNIQRQIQTEELMQHTREQARNQPEQSIVLIDGDDWHEGIIGLVAGKLSEEVGKPVLVLSNDPQTGLSRGSARSQKGYNIIAALRGFDQHLERYGGHAQAAGFTIQSSLIGQLREHLASWQESAARPVLIEGTDQPDETGVVTEQESSEATTLLPQKMVDLTFTKIELLNYQTYLLLRQLAPFGAGNPEPVFMMQQLRLLETRTSGPNKQNLSMRLGSASTNTTSVLKGTLTRGAVQQGQLKSVEHVNLVFRLDAAEYDIRPDVWLKVLDIESAS